MACPVCHASRHAARADRLFIITWWAAARAPPMIRRQTRRRLRTDALPNGRAFLQARCRSASVTLQPSATCDQCRRRLSRSIAVAQPRVAPIPVHRTAKETVIAHCPPAFERDTCAWFGIQRPLRLQVSCASRWATAITAAEPVPNRHGCRGARASRKTGCLTIERQAPEVQPVREGRQLRFLAGSHTQPGRLRSCFATAARPDTSAATFLIGCRDHHSRWRAADRLRPTDDRRLRVKTKAASNCRADPATGDLPAPRAPTPATAPHLDNRAGTSAPGLPARRQAWRDYTRSTVACVGNSRAWPSALAMDLQYGAGAVAPMRCADGAEQIDPQPHATGQRIWRPSPVLRRSSWCRRFKHARRSSAVGPSLPAVKRRRANCATGCWSGQRKASIVRCGLDAETDQRHHRRLRADGRGPFIGRRCDAPLR